MGGVEALDVSSMTGRVLDQLRAAITSGELEAGRLYSAAALGEQLGVSRTPIREASHELARLGLVEIERNRGIRIVATSVEALLQGFEVRLMLEVPLAAAPRAAPRTSRASAAASPRSTSGSAKRPPPATRSSRCAPTATSTPSCWS